MGPTHYLQQATTSRDQQEAKLLLLLLLLLPLLWGFTAAGIQKLHYYRIGAFLCFLAPRAVAILKLFPATQYFYPSPLIDLY